MDEGFRLLPLQASRLAGSVDALYYFLLSVTAFFTLLIATLIMYFSLKYRRRSEKAAPIVKTNYTLEVVWTIVPLGIVMVIFIWGANIYVHEFDSPADAMEIYVVGKQWMWKIQHPEGAREINALHVPQGRPIKLVLSSEDVIHSFFIPAFRIKHDAVPGRYTSMWFEPTRIGEYHLFCAEYCGTQHSGMVGKVVVMKPAEYQAWLAGTYADEPPARSGERLFQSLGCTTCHGQRAPTLTALYGSQVQLNDGTTVTADENYLRESILDSTAKIVAGYPPIMPSFRGQVSEEQLMQLLAYIKSLKTIQPEEVHKP